MPPRSRGIATRTTRSRDAQPTDSDKLSATRPSDGGGQGPHVSAALRREEARAVDARRDSYDVDERAAHALVAAEAGLVRGPRHVVPGVQQRLRMVDPHALDELRGRHPELRAEQTREVACADSDRRRERGDAVPLTR